MKKTSRLLVDIFLIITILLCILPFLYMILMSLKSTVNAYDFDFALSKLTLKHYKNIFTNSTFLRYFFNSVFLCCANVVFQRQYPVCFLHYLQAVLLVLHLRN